MGKRWNARLVIDHLFHDKIEALLKEAGPMNPHARIGKWQSTLSELIGGLSKEELAKYEIMAEKWRSEGPPKEIQMR